MIIVTNILNHPFDEGSKVSVFSIIQSYKKKHTCEIIDVNGNCELPFKVIKFRLNKLLFNYKFYGHVKYASGKNVLYIPNSSITPATFVRAKLLNIFTSKNISILSLQPIAYNIFNRFMISMIRPKKVITQSLRLANQLEGMGIKTSILPLGVDDKKFHERDCNKIKELRKKYSINLDQKIILHVGHIKKNRNIKWFVKVKKCLPNINILIIGSTSTYQEKAIRCTLEGMGIIVIRDYIPLIEEIYQLADYYAFPVQNRKAAIETPLSVLEAMATNLPILTTRFGSLNETFKEDKYFRYINSPEDIIAAIKKGFPDKCNNREKIRPFTWEKIADKLHELI